MKCRLGDCAEGSLVRLHGVQHRVVGSMGDVVVCQVVLGPELYGPCYTHWASTIAQREGATPAKPGSIPGENFTGPQAGVAS